MKDKKAKPVSEQTDTETLSDKMNECERYGDNCEVNIDKIKEDVRKSVNNILKRIAKLKMLIGTYSEVRDIIEEEVGPSLTSDKEELSKE